MELLLFTRKITLWFCLICIAYWVLVTLLEQFQYYRCYRKPVTRKGICHRKAKSEKEDKHD